MIDKEGVHMTNEQRLWSDRVVFVAAIFTGFGAAHLIDDFLFGVSTEIGIPNNISQIMALAFFAALTGLTALAARGRRQSYLGLIIIGILLALAELLKHVPEILAASYYRSGALSVSFVFGLLVSSIVTAAVAFRAWQISKV